MLKPLTFIAAILLLIGLLVFVEFSGGSSSASVFSDLAFDKAQTQAASATPPRLLIVEFIGEGCDACAEMDRKTWTHPAMVEWVRARAIAVRIDRDKDPGHARSLGVQSIPAVVLFDGKRLLTKLEGPHTARDLIDKLDAAIAANPKPAPEPPAPKPAEPDKPAEPKPADDPPTPPPPAPKDDPGRGAATARGPSPSSPP